MKSKHSTDCSEGLQCQFCSTKYSDQTELLNHVSANHSNETENVKRTKRKKNHMGKKEQNIGDKTTVADPDPLLLCPTDPRIKLYDGRIRICSDYPGPKFT